MTNPYPPYQGPRQFRRSRNNKVLGGVCGGVAEYTNMDPTLVRVLTVIISLFTGVPIIVYLIALFVIPEADADDGGPRGYPPVNGPQWTYGDPGQGDYLAQPYPPSPEPQAAPNTPYGQRPSEDPAVWGADGAPWEQPPAGPPAPGRSTHPSADPGDQPR
jgi:phage shock protein PspC (stress-responsive transcriptional regulator)